MKKLKIVIALFLLISISQNIYAQKNNRKWFFEGKIGLGFIDGKKSFATNVGIERFFIKRMSFCIDFNHLSTINIVKNNTSLYISKFDMPIDESKEELYSSLFSIFAFANYYPVKTNKLAISIGIGPAINLHHKKYIYYIENGKHTHVTINENGKFYLSLISKLGIQYIASKKTNITFDILGTESYGLNIAFLLGAKTEL